ncbi:MAG: hypothetical protein IPK66_11645 [Rhodospirillales bacterium]|nr:hypothetical protein [Rhodospirillales bacterium]
MSRLFMPFFVVGLMAGGVDAVAEPSGQATLNAVAFQPMPKAAALEVRVLNDSADNLAIKRELETALAAHGYSVGASEAPLIMTIDTGEDVGAWQYPSDSGSIRMMDDRGRLFPQGELNVTRMARLPLPKTTVVTPPQYRLGLTLDARANGVRLWQGWSIADLSQGEPAELAQAMVPKLAESVGETVREARFDLQ